MIPYDHITEWRSRAPWISDHQVEQDLIISRALVEMYRDEVLARSLAFRGGTALYKLFLLPAARYSVDIDLVQVTAGPVGPIFDRIKSFLDPWLGEPRRDQKEGRVNLVYRVLSEDRPPRPLRLKIEINSREHFALRGYVSVPFAVDSRWFAGNAAIRTYTIEELLATKLRALYQRKKGRDLFDLWYACRTVKVDTTLVASLFTKYLRRDGLRVSRAEFLANLAAKENDPTFGADVAPLLSSAIEWDMACALALVREEIIDRL